MKLNSIFSFLLPSDRKFYPLFEQASANLVTLAEVLVAGLKYPAGPERQRCVEQINELEHFGDKITHDIFLELSRNFITPFDREDVHSLTSDIDDVADYIHGAANRISVYQLDQITTPMHAIAECILEGAGELHRGVCLLKDSRKFDEIIQVCRRVKEIESKADRIFDQALNELFATETNAINLIKQKDILAALETATDRADDVANVLESIIVKHS